LPAPMFLDQTRAAARIAARLRRVGTDENMHFAVRRNSQHPEAESSAEIAKARIALASFSARRQARREPDFVAGWRAIDGLQHEFKIEVELQLADHDDGREVRAESDEIAMAYFPFDGKTEAFEELFDRLIE
jgi:hypothetical protein